MESPEVPAWLAAKLDRSGCPHDYSKAVEIPAKDLPPFVRGPVIDYYCIHCGTKRGLTEMLVQTPPQPLVETFVPPPALKTERVSLHPIPLDEIHIELDLEKYGKRFTNNRRKGIVDRAINVGTDAQWNDAMAAAAEQYVSLALGLHFPGDTERPDRGWDMHMRGRRIQVKWTKHSDGRLIASPKQHNVADYYVLVTGAKTEDFVLRGWATISELKASMTDLGYGPTYAVTQANLRPFEDLLAIRMSGEN